MRLQHALAGLAGAALTLMAIPAQASPEAAARFHPQPGDLTYVNGPMSLTVPAFPTFVAGSVTNIADFCGPGFPVYSQAKVKVAWKATSTAAPLANYSVTPLTYMGPALTPYVTKTANLVGWAGNYDGSCGGNGDVIAWQITAVDILGNAVSAEVLSLPEFTRFDNTSAVTIFSLGTWTYTGSWFVRNCLCADGGRQTYTTQKNASASFAYNAQFLGDHIALMMAEGPGRGSAAIYLDGLLKTTINTHATANLNRVITWDSGALTVGSHVIKIVNLATKGHPRIDVNAGITQGP
jgi:hypothetical protein